MVDIFSPRKRSAIMASVRSKDTKPERAVRSELHAAGFRFRKHVSELPGSPDVVLPRFKLAVFVHGCLWHGHDCKRGALPTTNADRWRKKIHANVDRDDRNRSALLERGWHVEIVWTCQTKAATARIIQKLNEQRSELNSGH
ncbi:very short patch repair endonuclease [Paradevosia shaoguanensis]|uniref:very short patch repair endonuclease n=1 Tax=Paradevosia shaoguanensis TaxID=1335043 RepID=UPI003C744EB2